MAYRKFKENECRYTYVKKKKAWKKEFSDGYEISERKIKLIKKCLDVIEDSIDGTSLERISKLARWADENEIEEKWYSYWYNSRGKPSGGYNLKTLQETYGDKKGLEIYQEKANRTRENNNLKSPFTIMYWINKGFAEEEAKLKISEHNRKRAKKRWEMVDKNHECRSTYAKRINPMCVEYHGYDGLDEEEIEEKRKVYLDKCIHSYEKYTELYGEEKATEIMAEIYSKKIETHLKNSEGVTTVKKLMASKESLKVFRPLSDYLLDLGFSFEDIQMGVKEFNGERWIRDPEDSTKYFLYDFTLKPLNVIIEFNGVAWHPNEEGTFISDNPRNLCGIEKRKSDLYKIKVAENMGYKVLEIWSDKTPEENIEICKEFLNEHGIFEIQNTRRS